MGEAEARALVARWFEIWRANDIGIVDEIFADPIVRHTGMGTERLSLKQYKERLVQAQRVLRGAKTTIDDQVVDGDRVWTRATSRGVNVETATADAESATVMTWLMIHRIADGRIAESWTATLPGVDWQQP